MFYILISVRIHAIKLITKLSAGHSNYFAKLMNFVIVLLCQSHYDDGVA